MSVVTVEDIVCPCLGDIILEREVLQDGKSVQHFLKCKTCQRTGFIKDNTFIYEWDEGGERHERRNV